MWGAMTQQSDVSASQRAWTVARLPSGDRQRSPKASVKNERRVWSETLTRYAAKVDLQNFKLLAPDLTLALVANSRLYGRDFNQIDTRTRPVTVSDERQVSSMPNGCQLH